MSLLRFSFQNETLILDVLLYLYNLSVVRHPYLYDFRSEGSIEKDREGDKYFFYRLNYLVCKRV